MEAFFDQVQDVLTDAEGRILINLDLDFFFLYLAGDHRCAFSDAFIDAILYLRAAHRHDSITTVAWSPSCTTGWRGSARLCRRLCSAFDLDCVADELRL